MEYIEGQSRGPCPRPRRCAWRCRLRRLEGAHRKGILHRDLKPANIMVTESGREAARLRPGQDDAPALSGDATMSAALSEHGVSARRPTCRRNRPKGNRRCALGCVHLRRRPVRDADGRARVCGRHTVATVSAVVNDEPPPLQAPAALDRIVRRCLAKQPGERFQTMADVGVALEQAAQSRPAEPHASIAVLPFANMSRDPDDDYFSDGLAEEIINLLAHVPNLKVTARTSSFAFRGKEQDIRRIAEALGVADDSRRQRPPRGKPDPRDGAAHQRRGRLSPVVRTLRPRAHRRLRHPGRHRPGHRRCVAIEARLEARQTHAQLSGLRSVAQSAASLESLLAGGARPRQGILRAGHRARSGICRSPRAVGFQLSLYDNAHVAGPCRRSRP